MVDERKIGVIRISWELLKQKIHMPLDTKILGCDFNYHGLDLFVEHSGLDPFMPLDGSEVPRYDPVVTYHEEKYEWKWK